MIAADTLLARDASAVLTELVCEECGHVAEGSASARESHLVDLDDDGEDDGVLVPRLSRA